MQGVTAEDHETASALRRRPHDWDAASRVEFAYLVGILETESYEIHVLHVMYALFRASSCSLCISTVDKARTIQMTADTFSSDSVSTRKCDLELFEPSIEMHIFASLRHASVSCQNVWHRLRFAIRSVPDAYFWRSTTRKAQNPEKFSVINLNSLLTDHTKNLTSWLERAPQHKTLNTG
jgi:hypothetical protein